MFLDESTNNTSTASTVAPDDLYRLLVESVQEYAIFLLDPNGNIMSWNAGAKAIKGYTAEEIIGQNFSKFYLPEAVENGWPQRELEIASREGRFSDEGWRVRKDGTSFWACVSITALRDREGRLCGFAKVTRDMSERRQWEERLQKLNHELRRRITQLTESQRLVQLRTAELQDLSGQLLHAQDEERRRVARELHDELGQQLTALKIMLEIDVLRNSKASRGPEALQMVDKLVQSVRNISYLLHPPLLDEAGLLPALHWYVEGFTKRSKIETEFVVKPTIFPRLSGDIEITIFRIVQESLTNVYRHSGSSKARVELEKKPESILVRVRDYGNGFNPELSDTLFTLGVGIGGMRERLKQLGGDLKVTNESPGTLVEANLPLFGMLHDADALL